jgi:hypothetical protein
MKQIMISIIAGGQSLAASACAQPVSWPVVFRGEPSKLDGRQDFEGTR